MVELRNVQRVRRIDTRGLMAHAQRILEALQLGENTLSLLLTDDGRMAELHARWMNDSTPTDVLSFPMFERGVLGDIAISVETAARRNPKNIEGEIRRYLLHGILHLAGYDHVRSKEKRLMENKARQLQAILKGEK